MAGIGRVNSGLGLVSNYDDEEDEDMRVPADSGVDNISGSDDDTQDSNEMATRKPRREHEATQPARSNMMRLVSYGADDIGDEEDEAEFSREEDIVMLPVAEPSVDAEPDLLMANYDVSLADTDSNKPPDDDVVLPPEPPGRCSKQLQDHINKKFEIVRAGHDLNSSIANNKAFRNPSIYEKLLLVCDIDEKGTNYPPELFDPSLWGPESYYDELARIQKVEMDKKEKEKKERTKVEFVAGVKKIDKSGDQKRKTKWDTQPHMMKPAVITTNSINPPVISVTTSASGAKTTVISAIGTITKKR